MTHDHETVALLAQYRKFYRDNDRMLQDNQYDIVRAKRRLAELEQEREELEAGREGIVRKIKELEAKE